MKGLVSWVASEILAFVTFSNTFCNSPIVNARLLTVVAVPIWEIGTPDCVKGKLLPGKGLGKLSGPLSFLFYAFEAKDNYNTCEKENWKNYISSHFSKAKLNLCAFVFF